MSTVEKLLYCHKDIPKASISYSFETPPGKITMSVNKNKILHSASLMKLPVMAALFRMYETDSLSLSSFVSPKTVYDSYVHGKTFSPGHTLENRKHTIFELIEKMITVSDNQATCALMEIVPFRNIYNILSDWGMKNTTVIRKVMDLPAHESGVDNYTTASDVCRFYRNLYFGKGINAQSRKAMIDLLLDQKLNNRIPAYISDKWPVAHKTGTITGRVYETGLVFSNPATVFSIMVIGLSKEKAADIIRKILKTYFSSMFR